MSTTTTLRQSLEDPRSRHKLQLALYRASFPHFSGYQLRVKSKEMALVPMMLNSAQAKLWRGMRQQLDNTGMIRQVWLKCRQCGSSTIAQAVLAWRTFLNPNINSMVVAHDTETSEAIFSIAKTFYECLEPWLQPKTRYYDKRGFVFEDGKRGGGLRSRMNIQTAGNLHAGVGHTIHCLHLTEAARYPNPKEIETSLFPTMPDVPGTAVIIESTGHVRGEWFRFICEAAESGDYGPYQYHFIPWFWQREYASIVPPDFELEAEERDLVEQHGLLLPQIAWRRNKIASFLGDIDRFRQEYPATPDEAWIPAGSLVLPPDVLNRLARDVAPPKRRCEVLPGPLILDNPRGNLVIWEEPERGVPYDIGVDVAMGIEGGDYSVASVIRRKDLKQVAEWHGHIDPVAFAEPLRWLAIFYNEAQIAVEANSIGYATNGELAQSYYNLYRWRYRDEVGIKISNKTGWWTTERTKQMLVSYMRNLCIQQQVTVRSTNLMEELRGYTVDEKGKYGAAAGYFDDCVVAWSIALVAARDEDFWRYQHGELPRIETEDEERRKNWREPGAFDGNPLRQESKESYLEEIRAWDYQGL